MTSRSYIDLNHDLLLFTALTKEPSMEDNLILETAKCNPNKPPFLKVAIRHFTIAIVIISDYKRSSVGKMLKVISVAYLWENIVESITSNDQYEILIIVNFGNRNSILNQDKWKSI